MANIQVHDEETSESMFDVFKGIFAQCDEVVLSVRNIALLQFYSLIYGFVQKTLISMLVYVM